MKPETNEKTKRLAPTDDSMCFCCGKANADGLHMEFVDDGEDVPQVEQKYEDNDDLNG